jgi:hypothetical protein
MSDTGESLVANRLGVPSARLRQSMIQVHKTLRESISPDWETGVDSALLGGGFQHPPRVFCAAALAWARKGGVRCASPNTIALYI